MDVHVQLAVYLGAYFNDKKTDQSTKSSLLLFYHILYLMFSCFKSNLDMKKWLKMLEEHLNIHRY